MRISQEALTSFASGKRYYELVQRVKARIAQQMLLDVFISYAFEDTERAERWRQAFERAQPQLAVHMSKPSATQQFEDEVNIALAESRIVLVVISKSALRSKWVAEEIRRRKEFFEAQHNILSITTEPGLAEKVASGISPIAIGEAGSAQEKDAMQQAIDLVRLVKTGGAPPPLSTRLSQGFLG